METFCTFVGNSRRFVLSLLRLLTCAQKGFLVSPMWIAYWVGQHRSNFTRFKASQFDDAGVHPTDAELDSDEVKEMRENGKTKGKGKGKRRRAKRASSASAAVREPSTSSR